MIPDTGTNYVDVNVHFDSNEVEGPGFYSGYMSIAANDADENPTMIPLEMMVGGGGIPERHRDR